MAEQSNTQNVCACGCSCCTNGTAGINNSTAKDNANASVSFEKAFTTGKKLSMQIINRHVASIGSRTGNYVLQERAQTGVNAASKLIDIGVSFITNPVIGMVNLVSEGVGLVFDIAERNREIMWQNKSANELARRAGYLSGENR